MDFGFLGGSLGSAAGELFAQGCELATAEQRALIVVASSGGARDAGGDRLPRSDGALHRGGQPGRRRRPAVHLDPRRPLLRRGDRVVRGPGRRDPRRARRPDRLRRRPGDRAGRPRGPARGVPDLRVPAQPRDGRPGCGSPRAASDGGQAAARPRRAGQVGARDRFGGARHHRRRTRAPPTAPGCPASTRRGTATRASPPRSGSVGPLRRSNWPAIQAVPAPCS